MPILSTGKLLSNMQRSAPKRSMHGSMYGRQSAASSVGGGRRGRRAVVEGGQAHHHAAELHASRSGTCASSRIAGLPGGEDLVALARVRPVAERPADVAHDDVGVGDAARQLDRVGELRMKDPGVERQAERGEPRQARRGTPCRCIPCGPVATPMLPMIGLASHAAEWRTPRKRPPPARMCACSTGSTRSPSVRSAKPTMPAATRVGPYCPLSLMAAMPATNSVSPTGRISTGPSARYIAWHSRNTVATTLWPVRRSASSSCEQVAMIRPVPQVMVRVDDRQVRLEDRLARGPGQPRLVGWMDPAVLGRRGMRRLAHVRLISM